LARYGALAGEELKTDRQLRLFRNSLFLGYMGKCNGDASDNNGISMRVFILGSGFSKAAGFPLDSELFKEIMKSKHTQEWTRKYIQGYLQRIYPYFNPKYENYPIIEDFLTALDASQELDFSFFHEKRPSSEEKQGDYLRKLMSELIVRFLLRKSIDISIIGLQGNAPVLMKYIYFIKNLKPGDAVLTFNYDCLLEYVISELDKLEPNHPREFIYHGFDQSKIAILKLHGSVGWFPDQFETHETSITRNTAIYRGDGKNIFEVDFNAFKTLKKKGFIEYSMLFSAMHELLNMPVYIIPPQNNKSLKSVVGIELLTKIWCDSLSYLKVAEKVNTIGYSLPPQDMLARVLIREGILNNPIVDKDTGLPKTESFLSIYDPRIAVKTEFEKNVIKQVEFHPVLFENSEFVN